MWTIGRTRAARARRCALWLLACSSLSLIACGDDDATSDADAPRDDRSAQGSGSAGTSSDPSTGAGSGSQDAGSAATTTGDAGTSSQAGDAPDAGAPETLAPCPAALPQAGDACDEPGLLCTYGDDPRGYRCRDQAQCLADGGFAVATPDCAPLQTLAACPAPPAELADTACDDAGDLCEADGMRCTCAPCSRDVIELCEGGQCSQEVSFSCDAQALRFSCDEAPADVCPATPPQLGSPCALEQPHPVCRYFDAECGVDQSYLCLSGRWDALSTLGFGADCEGRIAALSQVCPADLPAAMSPCPAAYRGSENLLCDYACGSVRCTGYTWSSCFTP